MSDMIDIQAIWVIWSIFSSVSSDMLRYVMEKLSLGELTRVSILLANEISMFDIYVS